MVCGEGAAAAGTWGPCANPNLEKKNVKSEYFNGKFDIFWLIFNCSKQTYTLSSVPNLGKLFFFNFDVFRAFKKKQSW